MTAPTGFYDHAGRWREYRTNPPRPTNRRLVLIGADDGSTGFDVYVEWTDGSLGDRLFRIEPGGDATAVGMIFGETRFPEPHIRRDSL